MTQLPTGWTLATVPDVADILDSKRVPLNADERSQRINGKAIDSLIPYYGATGQVGYVDSYIYDENLVLLGEDGVPFLDALKKKAYRISGKSWVNNHAHVLRANTQVLDWRLLEAQLNTLNYVGYVSGSTRLKLTQAAMNKLPIFVPPLNEQCRIADKLDTTLARVDALNDRLARITPLLKRFRQSVLAAATSGRLTEDWVLQYSLPEAHQCTLKEVIKVSSGDGLTAKNMNSDGGIPVFGGNGINGYHDQHNVNESTIVIGRVGYYCGSVHLTPEKAWVTDNALKVAYDKQYINKKFLYYSLLGNDLRKNVSSTAQPVISGQKIYSLPFRLPVIEEQTEIVRRVETLFAFADRLEARLQSAQTAAERLTPALLAKAFRGELVPQDPNDEPAAELLRRLREARAADTASKPKRGRAAKAPTVSE